MKYIVTLITTLLWGINLAQNLESDWLKNVPIKLSDYRFKRLGVQQIEIFTLDFKQHSGDLEEKPVHINMNYLIRYDSLHNISSIKYNFRSTTVLVPFPNISEYDFSKNEDNLKHDLIFRNDTITFTCWRNDYHYEGTSLKRIDIKHPYRIEDGVFLLDPQVEIVREENTYEGHLLIRTKRFHDNQLFNTTEYEYTTFSNGNEEYPLLSIIKVTFEKKDWHYQQVI